MFQFLHRAESQTDESPVSQYDRLKTELHQELVDTVDVSRVNRWSNDRLRNEVRALAEEVVRAKQTRLEDHDTDKLVEELLQEAFGLGPLEPLMAEPDVADILVNGPGIVYVERRGKLEPTNVSFADNDHIMRLIHRIASWVGRRIDESSPMLDARLPDGSRVNAVVPPLTLDGPSISIRRFGHNLKVEDLLETNSVPQEMMHFLESAIKARLNIVISGGTGAGKTTLLNILSSYIPHEERLVTVEDSAELLLRQPHVVRMETRPANLEGIGEITQRQLVRNSLRMRPDRIIVGECRGAEALDMLQAMNTGHEGSMTTLHANSTRDALSRLEVMVTQAGFDLAVPTIRNYIASAVTLIVHLTRLQGGQRKLMRISELGRLKDNGHHRVRDVFGFRQTDVQDGKAVGEFYATGRLPRCLSRIRASGIALDDALFEKRVL